MSGQGASHLTAHLLQQCLAARDRVGHVGGAGDEVEGLVDPGGGELLLIEGDGTGDGEDGQPSIQGLCAGWRVQWAPG